MAPITASIDIDCPVETVFAHVTDPSRFGGWQENVTSGHMDGDAPHRVRAICRTTRRIGFAERPATKGPLGSNTSGRSDGTLSAMRWARPFVLALVLAGSFVLPAHASITSDAYDPAWPEAIHCPAAIGDHALSSLFTVTGDDQQTKSLEVGDRFIDCKYGDVVRLT